MREQLFVFAVNAETDLRHTHLTRAEGAIPDLPPLTDWLGAEVDEGAVELFPVEDLGDMALSDYVTMAFAPEAITAKDARRMNGLKGHVLLVPERALSEEPAPGPEAALIATLPLARADHAATLPKAEVTPLPRTAPAPRRKPARRGSLPWVMLGLGVILLILLWVL